MLFADGYNLRKRRFFHNVYYINVYGLLGTILNFLTIALLVYAVSEAGELYTIYRICEGYQ
jgi:sodium/hydrogen exchanger-like protein 6/7